MKSLPSYELRMEVNSCSILPSVAVFRYSVWGQPRRKHALGRRLKSATSRAQQVPASASHNGAINSATEPAFVGLPRVAEAETELVFQRPGTTQYKVNVIAGSRWPDGIPAVMGAHLMASGAVTPISISTGPGVGVQPHLFTYLDGIDGVSILQYANQKSALVGLTQLLGDVAERCIKARGAFAVAGSPEVLAGLAPHLGSLESGTLQKWQVGFTDQAVLGSHSASATATQALDLLAKAGISESQILRAQEQLPVDQAAVEYAGQLLRLPLTFLPRTHEGFPVFDVVLLNVGQDGSVASLYPNRKETAATHTEWCLPVSRAECAPSVTVSMPVVNSAQRVFLVALGQGKAEVVQRALEVQSLPGALPAQLVRPASGTLTWVLDSASSETLSVASWQQKGSFPRSTLPSADSIS